jgi:hypothetical protein
LIRLLQNGVMSKVPTAGIIPGTLPQTRLFGLTAELPVTRPKHSWKRYARTQTGDRL